MTLVIQLFGPQAILAGDTAVTLELAGTAPTAGQVMAQLSQAVPKLAPSLQASRLAVNHAYVHTDHVIAADDEVALIGMVSGG